MPSVSELKRSRRRRTTIDALNDMRTRSYIARNYATDADAESAVLAVAPTTVDSFPIAEVNTMEIVYGQVYIIDLLYAKQNFDPEFQFDISGRSVKRLIPITLRSSLPSSFPAPKVIHDRGDGTADGVDGFDAEYAFSERYYFDKAAIGGAYKATLFACTGKMIDRAWRGFSTGEVLLLGVTGTQRGNLPWVLDYRFIARPNAVNQVWTLESGDVTVPLKYGHDYQWFSTLPKAPSVGATDPAPSLLTLPAAVHVGQVVEFFNPLLLGIGS